MSDIFKPMLATDADLTKLRFPLLASPKLDGVRAVVRNGIVYSRSNKPIPNKFVQERFNHLEYFDGELIVGEANSATVYRDTVSHVMSHDKTGFDLRFYVFDHVKDMNKTYGQRVKDFEHCASYFPHEQVLFKNLKDLLEYEEEMLDIGFEGLILRDPNAPYKMGRSTVKEGYLLKLKRFTDDEAVVIGFQERQHNANEAVTNELGRTSRSSRKENKVPMGTLGALNCRSGSIEFSIGTGFTDEERLDIWNNPSKYIGRLVKFKHFTVGAKDAPRHPVFLGWRDRIDT